MQLLASCSLEKSREFNGRLVLPNENKKTPDKVMLNIVVGENENPEDIFKGLSGKERCITFCKENPANYCPTSLVGNVFNECSVEQLECGDFPMPEGVVTLVRLPEDYCDMRTLKIFCDRYPTVRFIGGNLLGVEGVRIGRYDEGKEKMSPVFCDNIYDNFVEVDLNDLDGLQEIVKQTRSRAEGIIGAKSAKRSKGKSGVKKQPKRLETFSKLFSSEEEEF